jgi:hypothetical protein
MARSKVICFLLAVSFLLATIADRAESARSPIGEQPLVFKSYRDIPGVTEAEIKAVEALRERAEPFVHGMMHTTAAFDRYGDVFTEDFFPLTYAPVSFTTQNPELAPVISQAFRAA